MFSTCKNYLNDFAISLTIISVTNENNTITLIGPVNLIFIYKTTVPL